MEQYADCHYQYYNNLKYIAYDEQVHVQALSAAISAAGATPVQACTYSFPYTDVASFITLSSVLEGVGTSAYLGGAPLITSKQYLTVAGSILATEALHTSYQRAAIGEVPMANPFETPLNPNPVFTLAAAFIVSCPANNPPLPFTAFPTLTATKGQCVPEGPSGSGYNKRSGWEDYNNEMASSTMEEYSKATPEAASKTDEYESMSTGWEHAKPSEKPEGAYQSQHEGGWGNHNEASKTMDYASKGGEYTKTMTQYAPSGTSGAGCALPSKVACAAPAGSAYTFTAASNIPKGSFVTFASGLSVASVQGQINGNTVTANIPAIAMGQTYVFITSVAETTMVNDADILFGPAIIEVAPPSPPLDNSIQ